MSDILFIVMLVGISLCCLICSPLLPIPIHKQSSYELGAEAWPDRAALCRFVVVNFLHNHEFHCKTSFLKCSSYIIEELQFLFKSLIFVCFDDFDQVKVSFCKSVLDLKVCSQLSKADWTESKRFDISLRNQIRSVHKAFVVRTVCHSKNMANLMASCFDASVHKQHRISV